MLIFIEYLYFKILKKLRGSAKLNCTVHSTSKVESGSALVNVVIDRYSFCGYDCEIINADIGSFCSIANRVTIGGANHPIDWISTSPVFYLGRDSVKKKFYNHQRPLDKRTIIGNDVWIGNNVVIKQGVNIGTGSVIGMGSIVTKNVEPYSIVVGNPARHIRNRFSSELVQKILASEWWNLEEVQLKKVGKYAKNPEEFINNIKK
jgi:chloramphenicol O-acetyltransferase type B